MQDARLNVNKIYKSPSKTPGEKSTDNRSNPQLKMTNTNLSHESRSNIQMVPNSQLLKRGSNNGSMTRLG